ncbi:MAG: efflux RND transporter periplasmic adaptor subunit [Nannocystaceae bacterium]
MTSDNMTTEAPKSEERVSAGTPANTRGWKYGASILALTVASFGVGRCSVPRTEPAVAASEEVPASHDYVCPMHPQIRLTTPGKCPVCGMDLAEETATEASASPEEVTLSDRSRALAKLQVASVERSSGARELHLLGTVVPDESRLRAVTSWTGGRIDKLVVRTTGAQVRRGQVIAELYSPELYAATRDYLVALNRRDELRNSDASGDWMDGTTKAARARLELLGMQAAAIGRLEETRKAPKTIKVRSQFSGTVIERRVETGNFVTAGAPLLSLADLSRVWVEVEAFESDLPLLTVGQQVVVTPSATGGAPFSGTVSFIDPVLDVAARTAKVRVEVSNPQGALRPGMFVHARVESKLEAEGGLLSIPETAVLWTGRRSIVYVEKPGAATPSYALREVVVGPKAGSVYPVISGLSEGERVVVRGAFVLDADLQLRGKHSMMDMVGEADASLPPTFTVTDAMLNALEPVVRGYLDAQEALAADDIERGRTALDTLATVATALQPDGSSKSNEAWEQIASSLIGYARKAHRSEGAADVRIAFEDLNTPMNRILSLFGNPLSESVQTAFCPMAFDNNGAGWVQRTGSLANPYYGAAMLRCGEVSATVAAGERLAHSSDAAMNPK